LCCSKPGPAAAARRRVSWPATMPSWWRAWLITGCVQRCGAPCVLNGVGAVPCTQQTAGQGRSGVSSGDASADAAPCRLAHSPPPRPRPRPARARAGVAGGVQHRPGPGRAGKAHGNSHRIQGRVRAAHRAQAISGGAAQVGRAPGPGTRRVRCACTPLPPGPGTASRPPHTAGWAWATRACRPRLLRCRQREEHRRLHRERHQVNALQPRAAPGRQSPAGQEAGQPADCKGG